MSKTIQEYKTITFALSETVEVGELERQLNHYGQDGWQAVGVISHKYKKVVGGLVLLTREAKVSDV